MPPYDVQPFLLFHLDEMLSPKHPLGASFASSSCLARLADRLSACTSVTVLTGAGISTESGLSDYRSPERKVPLRRPTNHNDYVSSEFVRQRYWARSFVGYPLLSTAKPGLAHHALATLHDRGGHLFRSHITQNVDGLLQAARLSTSRIIELHGSMHYLKCNTCKTTESRTSFQSRLRHMNQSWVGELHRNYEYRPDGDAELDERHVASFNVPRCTSCGSDTLMPAVIFHGGSIPSSVNENASRTIDASDALLVIGSTLTPFSAFRLARRAKADSKFIACINYGPTRADAMFDMKIEALIGDAVSRLADRMLVGGFTPLPTVTFPPSLRPLHHGQQPPVGRSTAR